MVYINGAGVVDLVRSLEQNSPSSRFTGPVSITRELVMYDSMKQDRSMSTIARVRLEYSW